jgi:CheY-like chemotaxis protein
MSSQGGRPARVLVADDDAATRELLEIMIGLQPHLQVAAVADDGRRAFELVAAGGIDVALLDQHMPGLDGLTVAELLRSYRPETHVVLYTAARDARIDRRARVLGLTVVAKGDFDRLTASLGELTRAPARDSTGPPVEAIVLAAVSADGADGVFVVDAEEQVLFYNSSAAEIIGLELPARPLPLAELRRRWRPVMEDGRPREHETLPIERARRERQPITEVIWKQAEDDERPRRVVLTIIPYFAADDQFVGAAVYLTTAAGTDSLQVAVT